jgi:hypothetical protein
MRSAFDIRTSLKLAVKNFMLSRANVGQIHIVGCARSGTTMLHYSLAAFDGTILHDSETCVWSSPDRMQSIGLLKGRLFAVDRAYYVTKRSFEWYEPDAIAKLAEYVRRFQVFLINIIRDPRDVLTSRHARDKKGSYYVDPDRWKRSMEAADRLLQLLDGYPYTLTVRYEDVVLNSRGFEETVRTRFGMKLRETLKNIDGLKDNLEALKLNVGRVKAMHTLRNFDPESIGRWKKSADEVVYLDEISKKADYKDVLYNTLDRYNYD